MKIRDDIRTIENSKIKLFDEKRINDYLSSVKNERRNLAENVSDSEILELMGVTSEGVPTLAGLMTFSKYPQTYFPQLCITAVSLPGTEMGATGTDGERFIDNKRITGAIPDMLDEVVFHFYFLLSEKWWDHKIKLYTRINASRVGLFIISHI